MNKEFDVEIATKVYYMFQSNTIPTTRNKNFDVILKKGNFWTEIYKLPLFDQFLLVRYAAKYQSKIFDDDVNFDQFYNWGIKNQEYMLYDPRPKIVQFVDSKWHSFKYSICSGTYWKAKYWRLRYGRYGWVHIKFSSKWYKPIFKDYKNG